MERWQAATVGLRLGYAGAEIGGDHTEVPNVECVNACCIYFARTSDEQGVIDDRT